MKGIEAVVNIFMLNPYRPYNKPAFLALIPPSFTSLDPFVTFFRPLQPHSNVLVRGKPRTLIPGECGALAGDLSGFQWSSLPQCAGCWTTLDTNNSDRGPLAGFRF